MLKTAPSCCKILQNHPFVTCWLSDHATSFHLCDLQVPQFSGQIGHHLSHKATEKIKYSRCQSTWFIPGSCWKFHPQKHFFFFFFLRLHSVQEKEACGWTLTSQASGDSWAMWWPRLWPLIPSQPALVRPPQHHQLTTRWHKHDPSWTQGGDQWLQHSTLSATRGLSDPGGEGPEAGGRKPHHKSHTHGGGRFLRSKHWGSCFKAHSRNCVGCC